MVSYHNHRGETYYFISEANVISVLFLNLVKKKIVLPSKMIEKKSC